MKKNFFNKQNIYYLLLVINSFAFIFFYGNQGVFPIDSFFIYDAGFHVLNGNHPFKDYWSITGPLLDYIQSFLFYLFGVKWLSYVLHAAIFNSFISIICFYFLIKIGLEKTFSFLYSLGVSILAYTSIGSPFVDHHAVIFCLASVCFFSLAMLHNKKIYWLYSSSLLVLSFFSKQIPSSYIVFLMIFFLVTYLSTFYSKKFFFNSVMFYALGGLVPLMVIFLFFIINEIPLKNFIIQYLLYPMSIGENRVSNFNFNFNNLINQFKFIYVSLIPVFVTILLLLKKTRKNDNTKKEIFNLSFIILSALIFIYSQLITKNQVLIFFIIPFYLGISHYYLNKYFVKKHEHKKIFIYPILLILLFVTTKYHFRFNVERKFIELSNVDLSLSKKAGQIDQSLKGLNWISSKFPTNPQKEINFLIEVKNILNKDKKNKFLVTDYQFLASVSNSIKVSPNKWYDVLSMPPKDNRYFLNYKKFFLDNYKKNNIDNIYVVGKNEKKYIYNLINKKSCIESKRINEILILISLKDCKI